MSTVSARKLRANRRNAQKSTGPKTPEGKAVSSQNAITHGLFAGNLLLPGEDEAIFQSFATGLLRSLNPRNWMELQLAERITAAGWKLRRVQAAEHRLYKIYIGKAQFEQREFQTDQFIRLRERVEDRERSLKRSKVNRDYYQQEYQKAETELKLHEQKMELPPAQPDPADMLLRMLGSENDPALDRLHRYEQRLQNGLHRAMKELRELQKQDEPEMSDLVQSMLYEQTADVENEATDAADDAKDSKQEELATDGARMNTDEMQEDESQMVESVPMNVHGTVVGTPIDVPKPS